MNRVSDGVIAAVKKAIGDLLILDMVREKIEWEVYPGLVQLPDDNATLGFMICIGLPVPGADERLMQFTLIHDDDPAVVGRTVRALYGKVQADLDALLGIPAAEHTTPGGLIIS